MQVLLMLRTVGMGEEGVSEDVPVWRPLLPHTKDEIFQFAHKFGVPYFKDTTPAWSTRGHMRNQLMPLLKVWARHTESERAVACRPPQPPPPPQTISTAMARNPLWARVSRIGPLGDSLATSISFPMKVTPNEFWPEPPLGAPTSTHF